MFSFSAITFNTFTQKVFAMFEKNSISLFPDCIHDTLFFSELTQESYKLECLAGKSATTQSITALSIMTFSVTTLSIMTLSIMTLSIMTLSIMILSIMTLGIMTLSTMIQKH
jgi:hypothetical protein